MDSNHRRHCQQIYSLSPLATREFPHINLCRLLRWSWWTDSNPRPADYKSAALPTELHQHLTGSIIIANAGAFVNSFFSKSHFFFMLLFSPPDSSMARRRYRRCRAYALFHVHLDTSVFICSVHGITVRGKAFKRLRRGVPIVVIPDAYYRRVRTDG